MPEPKAKRKAAKQDSKEDFNQAAFPVVQESTSESMTGAKKPIER
jgi:hypothetical protein